MSTTNYVMYHCLVVLTLRYEREIHTQVTSLDLDPGLQDRVKWVRRLESHGVFPWYFGLPGETRTYILVERQ